MKEVVKMKENIHTEPTGTMPQLDAKQHMQAAPKTMPVQAAPNVLPEQTIPKAQQAQAQSETMPVQPNPANVMPFAMTQMPIMCCPYLMNMQCPMMHTQNMMGMNMMNNMMHSAVSPSANNSGYLPGGSNALLGAADNGLNKYSHFYQY